MIKQWSWSIERPYNLLERKSVLSLSVHRLSILNVSSVLRDCKLSEILEVIVRPVHGIHARGTREKNSVRGYPIEGSQTIWKKKSVELRSTYPRPIYAPKRANFRMVPTKYRFLREVRTMRKKTDLSKVFWNSQTKMGVAAHFFRHN